MLGREEGIAGKTERAMAAPGGGLHADPQGLAELVATENPGGCLPHLNRLRRHHRSLGGHGFERHAALGAKAKLGWVGDSAAGAGGVLRFHDLGQHQRRYRTRHPRSARRLVELQRGWLKNRRRGWLGDGGERQRVNGTDDEDRFTTGAAGVPSWSGVCPLGRRRARQRDGQHGRSGHARRGHGAIRGRGGRHRAGDRPAGMALGPLRGLAH